MIDNSMIMKIKYNILYESYWQYVEFHENYKTATGNYKKVIEHYMKCITNSKKDIV